MSGRRLVAVLCLTVAATAVVPPLLAWWLNARRERHTREMLELTARERVTGRIGSDGPTSVFCVDGRRPDMDATTAATRGLSAAMPTHRVWLEAATANARDAALPSDATDAWGRCLFLRSGGQQPTLLLSAGANGVVETPLRAAAAAAGDDLLIVMK